MSYLKTKSRATMKGEWYEVKVAALFFLRLKNEHSVKHFRLATNVEGAGALDDIVVNYTTWVEPASWHTGCVQLKHKQRGASREESAKLFAASFAGTTGDFALQKYFKSYLEIKNTMCLNSIERPALFQGEFELSEYAIYTNSLVERKFYETKVNKNTPSGKFDLQYFLKSQSENEFVFRFDPVDDASLLSAMGDGEEVREFLQRLTIFTGQPTEGQLDDIIKRELLKFYGPSVSDAAQIYRICEWMFKEWWRDSDLYLDETSDILQRALQQLQVETEMTRQIAVCTLDGVHFVDDFSETFRLKLKTVSLLHVISTDGKVRLSATKVLRQLQKDNELFSFLGLNYLIDNQDTLLLTWESSSKDHLIIVNNFPLRNKHDTLERLCEDVSSVLQENASRKVVLVSLQDCPFAFNLKSIFQGSYDYLQDRSNFVDLDKMSQERTFVKELSFQGQMTTLKSLLNGDEDVMVEVLSRGFAESLLSTEAVTIGPTLPEVLPHFIPRLVTVHKCLKMDVLNSDDFRGVLAFTGVTMQDLQVLVGESDVVRHISDPDCRDSRFLVLDENNAVEQYEELCQARQGVHWLHMEGGGITWTRSLTDIENIRRYVLDEHADTFVSFHDVMNVSPRGIVLIGEPGMGKSTLMTYLAADVKGTSPGDWVIHISLREQSELLNKLSRGGVGTFLKSAAKLSSDLEETLLHASLKQTGNLFVFLDGFDEICPKYKVEGCRLLRELLATKVKKVVVSARNSMRNLLEDCLSTLAFEIVEFSEDNQRSFFQRYWSQFPTTMTAQQMEVFITNLMRSVNSISERGRPLMGIPLQTMMLADIFRDYVKNSESVDLPKNLDHIYLFEEFIKKKFNIFFEKCSLNSIKAEVEENFMKIHTYAALKLLVSEDQMRYLVFDFVEAILKCHRVLFERVEEGSYNAGIIVNVVNGQPIFIHQTFAEYFAGSWFSKNFLANRDFLERHSFEPGFKVVRGMFDRLLAKEQDLHTAVLNGDSDRVEVLLTSHHMKVNSLDRGGRTPLHLAAALGFSSHHTFSPDAIFIYQGRKEGPRSRHVVELLLQHGADANLTDHVFKWTPLQYAIAASSWDSVEYLLQDQNYTRQIKRKEFSKKLNIDSCLLSIIIEHRFINFAHMLFRCGLSANFKLTATSTLLHFASRVGDVDMVNLLLVKGADLKAKNEMGDTPLHLAAKFSHFSLVRCLIQGRKNNVSFGCFESEASLTNKYINTKNSRLQCVLHTACIGGSPDIVQFIINCGGDIWARDREDKTCLFFAALKGYLNVVQVLIESIGDDEEAVARYINTRDRFGYTALRESSRKGSSELVEFFLQHGGDVWIEDDIGRNCLHVAAERGRLCVVEALVRSVGDDHVTVVRYVNSRDSLGNSVLRAACYGRFVDVVRLLIRLGGDIWSTGDDGMNCIHIATLGGCHSVIQVLVESLGDDREAVVKYLNTRNARGKTPLEWAIEESWVNTIIYLRRVLEENSQK